MAISSMTGFGRWETRLAGHALVVEIRTVNHRFFDTSMRLPPVLIPSEQRIREVLQASLKRGRVSISIDLDGSGGEGKVVPDEARIDGYVRLARRLKKDYRLTGELDINTLLSFPDVLQEKRADLSEQEVWPVVEKGVRRALRGVLQMRRREGRAMAADMRKRLAGLRTALARVERRMPRRVEEARNDLRRRIAEVLEGGLVDEERLANEIAILADRLDCTEEVVRARSHIHQFLLALREGGPAGRKLSFLLQELQREVNTVGAKANDSRVSREVVSMKEEVERLREQVQNIE